MAPSPPPRRPKLPKDTEPQKPSAHPRRTEYPRASCPRVKDDQLQDMIEKAWEADWWCEKAENGHVQCYEWPITDGTRGRIVTVANTPSDHRTVPNTRSTFRRAGLNL